MRISFPLGQVFADSASAPAVPENGLAAARRRGARRPITAEI
jgi:hypothetical protein